MRRTLYMVYAGFSYVLFLGVFLYLIGFLGNLLVPRSVDVGPAAPAGLALLVNLVLLALFALQHSVMARPKFKRWWTRIVPKPIERATYVLLTNVVLLLLFAFWRPIPTTVWRVESAAGSAGLMALFAAGWALVLYATVLIDHFELFGLRQVIRHWKGEQRPRSRFVTPSLYRLVRHPLYVGWLVVFFAAPVMTVGHALFAAVMTGYILIAIRFEERDLEEELGDAYRLYRETTPMLVPSPRRRAGDAAPAS